jgi:hypothetical protein
LETPKDIVSKETSKDILSPKGVKDSTWHTPGGPELMTTKNINKDRKVIELNGDHKTKHRSSKKKSKNVPMKKDVPAKKVISTGKKSTWSKNPYDNTTWYSMPYIMQSEKTDTTTLNMPRTSQLQNISFRNVTLTIDNNDIDFDKIISDSDEGSAYSSSD